MAEPKKDHQFTPADEGTSSPKQLTQEALRHFERAGSKMGLADKLKKQRERAFAREKSGKRISLPSFHNKPEPRPSE